ncbi:hypothetical protein HGB13_03160 [bacterium]|nr:hypothetical protein [bacterium]
MGFFDFFKSMFKVQGSSGTYTSGKDRPLDDPEKDIEMANMDNDSNDIE